MANVTVKSLTNNQISRLRTEAFQAGDHMMGVICDLALDGEVDTDNYTVLDAGEVRRIGAMSRDEAYTEIVRVINDAAARSGPVIDPDAQCPEHGCARWRCDADHEVQS